MLNYSLIYSLRIRLSNTRIIFPIRLIDTEISAFKKHTKKLFKNIKLVQIYLKTSKGSEILAKKTWSCSTAAILKVCSAES